MRPIIKTIGTLLLLGIFLFACGRGDRNGRKWVESKEKIKILSTIAQIDDLVAFIGGERVDCFVLIPRDLDPHSYELVKGDGEKLSRANFIFHNGLNLEHGASLSTFLKESSKAMAIGEVIQQMMPERILKRDQVIDPHIWMDIDLWKRAIGPIAQKLSELDPEGSIDYWNRAKILEQKMEQVDRMVRDRLQRIPPEKRFLVTSHDAFRYFARAYLAVEGEEDWFNRITAPEGLTPDGQLNPVDIQKTITFLQSHRIPVVFPESNVNQDAIVKIALTTREQGFPVRICEEPLYGDSPSGLTYLQMMQRNAEVIAQHLE